MKVRFENDDSDWTKGLYITPETEFEKHWLESNYKDSSTVTVGIVNEPVDEDAEAHGSHLDYCGILLTESTKKADTEKNETHDCIWELSEISMALLGCRNGTVEQIKSAIQAFRSPDAQLFLNHLDNSRNGIFIGALNAAILKIKADPTYRAKAASDNEEMMDFGIKHAIEIIEKMISDVKGGE